MILGVPAAPQERGRAFIGCSPWAGVVPGPFFKLRLKYLNLVSMSITGLASDPTHLERQAGLTQQPSGLRGRRAEKHPTDSPSQIQTPAVPPGVLQDVAHKGRLAAFHS